MDGALTPDNMSPGLLKVPGLFAAIGSGDAGPVEKAIERLSRVRSAESIERILRELSASNKHLHRALLRVIAAIGGPAVEPAFKGSLPHTLRGGKARIPWASHALTCHLKEEAVPLLARKLQGGAVDERRVASWALWSIIRYHGTGRHDPAIMAKELRDAITGDPERYVAEYASGALGSLKDVRALPVLAELLDDAHPLVRAMAARALGGMEEKARPYLDSIVPLLSMSGSGEATIQPVPLKEGKTKVWTPTPEFPDGLVERRDHEEEKVAGGS